jgi:hypothetical protein
MKIKRVALATKYVIYLTDLNLILRSLKLVEDLEGLFLARASASSFWICKSKPLPSLRPRQKKSNIYMQIAEPLVL